MRLLPKLIFRVLLASIVLWAISCSPRYTIDPSDKVYRRIGYTKYYTKLNLTDSTTYQVVGKW